MELAQEGMVLAVETYCPAADGRSAARIEEEIIVTPKGAQVITLFPAEELPIANRYCSGRGVLMNRRGLPTPTRAMRLVSEARKRPAPH